MATNESARDATTPWRLAKRWLKKIPQAQYLYEKWRKWRAIRGFRIQFDEFARLSSRSPQRFTLRWEDQWPCLADNTGSTPIDRHYVFHTAWAARVLARTRPAVHVDISSYIYFSTIVSAFIPVRFFDYRPTSLGLDNLESGFADLAALSFPSDSIESLSCMHVVEHIGLGRYGDPLDPEGDIKAMRELRRVLLPGGHLIFVVPVGQPMIAFNAHRIYGYDQIIECFRGLELEEFALIPDSSEHGDLTRDASRTDAYDQKYGCGCFHFRKPV